MVLAPAPLAAPVAPITPPRAPTPAPADFDPFGFDTRSDDWLDVLESPEGFDTVDDWRDALEAARVADHAALDAEAARNGDVPSVIRETWVERSRLVHSCETCRCDIPPGDGSKAVTVSQFSKMSTLYYCLSCAMSGQGGNPNGPKIHEEMSEARPNTAGGSLSGERSK